MAEHGIEESGRTSASRGRGSRGLALAFLALLTWQSPQLLAEDESEATESKASARVAEGTLFLQQPDVSEDQVVFVYGHDLWLVGRAGGRAHRLTAVPGRELAPHFSPDGKRIAYSANYGGQIDVFTISVDGGQPVQHTWHPGADVVRGWTHDGSGILFSSRRHGSPPDAQLYTAPLAGGPPTRWPLPAVGHVSPSPDGKHLAYTPIRDAFHTWKRYRGGRLPPVWIYDLATHEVEVVPHERASDTSPVFVGQDVWFLSDRSGQMNLYRYLRASGRVEAVTNYGKDDYGLRGLREGDGVLATTRGGAIQIYDPAKKVWTALTVHVPHDGMGRRPRWQMAAGMTRWGTVSPNGKRAALEMRGEIVSLPREHGGPRMVTRTPGAHDRSPVWSPDGKRLAWFSDRSGEYQLIVAGEEGQDQEAYDLGGARFYYNPSWSPDGKRLLFVDKGNRIAYLDLASREVVEVSTSQGELGVWLPSAAWSPDNKWIAYEMIHPRTTYIRIALYDVEAKTHHVLTDGMSSAADPTFSPDGALLWFRASVDAGRKAFGLNMRSSVMRDTSSSVYVAVLKRDGKHPFPTRSDEAVAADKDDKKDKGDNRKGGKPEKKNSDDDKDADQEAADAEDEAKQPPSIDLEDLNQRILAVPVEKGNHRALRATSKGLLYITSKSAWGPGDLMHFSLSDRKSKKLASGVGGYDMAAKGKHLLLIQGKKWSLANGQGKDVKTLRLNDVRIHVDPAKEWAQILREVWRLQRDFFYDPNFHGVDWDAAWERWSALLPHVHHREDLNDLLAELMGELACGHEYVYGGESESNPQGPSVGLLGCDWAVAGKRYKIERIYRGQNWNTRLRAPLTEPGVDAREGDVLISVNGRPVTTQMSIYEAFAEAAKRPTKVELLRMGQAGDAASGPHSVTITPVGDESSLRRFAWIEANRERVRRRSEGRLAYIYMPNTGGGGIRAFDRDYYSQIDKKGLVLDERYNGGGKVADYVIQTLAQKPMCYWMNREGWVGRTPFATFDGPMVLVANEYAGSGGDWLPWAFQQAGLGPVVGTRTWGGLVGISWYPPLVDGGSITSASFGIMDLQGNWIVENEGVTPDVEVIPYPKDFINGGDPQLDRAIDIALRAMRTHVPAKEPSYKAPAPR